MNQDSNNTCPKCGHRVLLESRRCLYCGHSWVQGEGKSQRRTIAGDQAHVTTDSSEKTEVHVLGKKDEGVQQRLEDLPPLLRKRVEEALNQSRGRTAVKTDTITHVVSNRPDASTGAASPEQSLKTPEGMITEDDLALFFAQERRKRKAPLNKVVQVLIFLLSAGLGALIVLLMM